MERTFKNQKIEIDKSKTYGYLTIIEEVPLNERPPNRGRMVKVKCSCNKEVLRNLYDVLNGNCNSCGCLKMKLQHQKREENTLNKYVGKKFGRLTIESLDHLDRNYGKTNWHKYMKCKCDCGNIIITLLSNLNAKKTQSCGCLSIEVKKCKNPWNFAYRTYKKGNADARLISFNLTEEQFISLVKSNCHYCGSEPQIKVRSKKIFRNGIDRIDCSIGYELSNCIPCCFTCNRAKNKISYEEFIAWINKLKCHTIKDIPILLE